MVLLPATALHGAASADVSITKTSSVALVNQSSAMSYTLTIANNDNGNDATGVTVSDTLPSGMGFVSASGTGWNCSTAGTPVVVTCTMATLAKKTSSVLTLNVTAPTSVVSGTVTFSNTATVASTSPADPTPGNNSSAVTVTLNRPPVAVNDSVSTASHTAVSGNVLTNDSDLDGNTLTVTNAGTYTLTYGALTINSNGSFTYTPGYFTGVTDTYSYTISDGHGGTATATLLINIASGCTATGMSNAERTFCLRKQTVLFGNMLTVGNTIVVPPTTQNSSVCSSYTTGPYYTDSPNVGSPSHPAENNELYLCNYKPDTYSNATSAEVIVPAGGKVKWAGLYLQSLVRESNATNLSSMDVKIKNGTSGYVSAGTPTIINYNYYFNANSRNYDGYSAFIDVTNVLTSNNWNGGTYTVANVPVTTDDFVGSIVQGKYGAWTLVVMYENPNESLKSFSVYDGWQQITGSASTNVGISNFYTPTSGSIDSKVSVFVAEGDKYRTGDHLQAQQGAAWVDLGNPTNNAFDSSIISTGTRTPNLNNNQGIDIKTYQVGTTGFNLLSNGQSSINFRFTTSNDNYMPSMLSFSTEVYQPRMCYYEDLYSGGIQLTTGAQVAKGSAIQAKVFLKNDMNATAQKVMVYRDFNSTMPYTANSTKVNNSNPVKTSYTTTSVTDNLDTDIFDYSNAINLFSLHVGTGATYNTGGDFVYNQTAAFDYNTTANFDGNTSIVYQIAYTVPSIGYKYEGELVKCVDFNNTFGVIPVTVVPTGTMNVIETAYYQAAGGYAAANKNLLTKIVNKPFTVEAVYLDTSGNEKVYNGNIGSNKTVDMGVMLYTTDTGTCSEERQLIWRGAIANGTSHVTANVDGIANPGGTTEGFLLAKAAKDQRIRANFIDYGTLINAATNLNCSASSLDSSLCLVPACLNSDTQVLNAFPLAKYPYVATCLYGDGSGNSAPCDSNAYTGSCGGKTRTIGPNKYNNDIGCAMCLADALGMNGCSTDNFAARPNQFQSTITAGQQFVAKLAASLTFNANDYSAVPAVDYNETEHSSFVADLNISDSTKSCAQPSLSFSPSINFINGTVTDNYTLGNVGDFNLSIHEYNNGTEYAAVDRDDTLDIDRLITPFLRQIKIVPAHFAVDGNLTNGSNGFTYLSNFEAYPTAASRTISAGLDLNITAQAADNNATTNYTGNCYAKDGNITVAINAFGVSPAGSLNKMIWYEKNHDINGSLAVPSTSFVVPLLHTTFDTAGANGTALVKYLLNFDRNQTKVVEPNLMVANTVSVLDSDAVAGTRTPTLNSAYYLYGRVNPLSTTAYGTTQPISAQSYMEVYGATPVTIGATALSTSKTSNTWWINSLHAVADGTANVTVTNPAGHTPAATTYANGATTYTNFANIPTPPFDFEAHIQTVPWLWYGTNALNYLDPSVANLNCLTHPCFIVKVRPAMTNWVGGGSEKGNKSQESTTGPQMGEDMLVPRIRQ